jgi:hypothetical protein
MPAPKKTNDKPLAGAAWIKERARNFSKRPSSQELVDRYENGCTLADDHSALRLPTILGFHIWRRLLGLFGMA